MQPKRLLIRVAATLVSLLAAVQAPAVTLADLEAELDAWESAAESGERSWNTARVLLDLGDRSGDKDERKAYYLRAVEQARAAVAASPDDTWGHHYLAAAVGSLALTEGGKRKIELSVEVRQEALRAIECDPRNDKSHHILGRWNREVTHLSPILRAVAKVVYGGLPEGASDEKALEHFHEAVRIAPDDVNHHLQLGITWMKMKEYDAAIAAFETALGLDDSAPNDPAHKTEAESLIRKCEKKVDRKKDRRRH